jgi:VanZ family protein
VVQSVVPGRTASGADAVANAVGAVVGVVAVLGWWLLAERD